MQMIDVLKRLAELDAANPAIDTSAMVVKSAQNISVNESQVEECGMMDMGRPSTPASINITAGSGDEIADMLATIMHLAGAKSPAADMGDELTGADGAAVVTAEPEMDATSSMRSVLDKMHPDADDEEGEEDDEEGEVVEEEAEEEEEEDDPPRKGKKRAASADPEAEASKKGKISLSDDSDSDTEIIPERRLRPKPPAES